MLQRCLINATVAVVVATTCFVDNVFARCVELPSYSAQIKMRAETCEFKQTLFSSSVFVRGTVTQLAVARKTHHTGKLPAVGDAYLFYASNVSSSFCKDLKKQAVISRSISPICCDANYSWCHADFEIFVSQSKSYQRGYDAAQQQAVVH